MVIVIVVAVVLLICGVASSAACYRRGRHASKQQPPRAAETVNPTFERTSVGLTPGPALCEEIGPGGVFERAQGGDHFYEDPVTANSAFTIFRSVDARADAAAYEAPVALNGVRKRADARQPARAYGWPRL